MRRNPDLIRAILLDIEAKEDTDPGFVLRGSEYSEQEINYHLELLAQAGFVKMFDNRFVESLTWEGHEFLDAAKDNNVWGKTKKSMTKALGATGSIPISVLKDLLILYLKQEIGLSPKE